MKSPPPPGGLFTYQRVAGSARRSARACLDPACCQILLAIPIPPDHRIRVADQRLRLGGSQHPFCHQEIHLLDKIAERLNGAARLATAEAPERPVEQGRQSPRLAPIQPASRHEISDTGLDDATVAPITTERPMKPFLAQLRTELQLVARNGEQLLLTLGIPVLLLVFFSLVDVLPTDTAEPIDFLAPGVLALAVMSTAIARFPDRYCPVIDAASAATSAGVPWLMTWPPCTPAPGPISKT